MHSTSSLCGCLAIWLVQVMLCAATGPQVDLGYATYEGTALSNGINQYLGMRYAAAPTGANRFKLPQSPLNETGVVVANHSGPICYGVLGGATEATPLATSEDCLFIDVFGPANASTAQLPVMLWIQGGGFVDNYNPDYNGTGLIEASGGNVIVVTFNYRVGPYGFLASEELAAEGNLNMGIQDQRAAINWVSQHIAEFGGDPARITLFGTSIGGGSVLLQTIAYGGNPPSEAVADWSAGIAASVYIPSINTVEAVQYQYDQILNTTKCLDLDCLRSLTSEEIQAANIVQPFPGQTNIPLFPYGPVIDGSLFTDQVSAMLVAGQFAKDKPIALGSSHTEGTLFTPQANTSADIASFLRIQFPDLTNNDISTIESLYDDIDSAPAGVTVEEAPLYFKLAKMYGDVSFACPTLDFAANLSEAGVPVHLFRDHIVDPAELAAGYIVPHTWELLAIWGPEYATQYGALPNATSYLPGQSNSFIVPQVQKYWTSFAITGGNPNDLKSASAPKWNEYAAETWSAWNDHAAGQRLKLQTNATAMEAIAPIEYARCAAWSKLSARTHI